MEPVKNQNVRFSLAVFLLAVLGVLLVSVLALNTYYLSEVARSVKPTEVDVKPLAINEVPQLELKLRHAVEGGDWGDIEPNMLNVWNAFNEDYQYSVMREGDNYRIFILHQFDVYVDQYNNNFDDKVGAVARGLRKLLIMSVLVSEEGEIIKDKSWEFDLYHDLLADDFLAKFAKPELWPYYVRLKLDAEAAEGE